MALPEEYLETFRRIWEAIRKELKVSDVRVIRSRRQALMKLEGEKGRLLASLQVPETRFVAETLEDVAERQQGVGRIEQLERTITGRKFAQDKFDKFLRKGKVDEEEEQNQL